MTEAIVADSRITRGIRLAAERADEFERVAAWTWRVPGCSGTQTYTVDLQHSYCTCPDFQIRRSKENRTPEPCKHVYAGEVVSAKRKRARPSSGRMVQDWRAVGAEDRKQKREFDPPTHSWRANEAYKRGYYGTGVA